MTSADVVAHYEHCLARDGEFTAASMAWIAEHGLDAAGFGLLIERAPFRLAVLDMLEEWPVLARLGRPAWVAEMESFTHTTEARND